MSQLLPEEQLQPTLRALAMQTVDRPGWDQLHRDITFKLGGGADAGNRAVAMYVRFVEIIEEEKLFYEVRDAIRKDSEAPSVDIALEAMRQP